ncbi:carboxylating nicotinate-nucleotide diphosphorylase [Alteromonadaceae bacterium BrNp21-10]|nr:carboxylating nicotinate-nucleotide diphosphorylase [Alteromonadaceae bacterium BrNp21-10]
MIDNTLLATEINRAVDAALKEDCGFLPANCADITAQLIPEQKEVKGRVITREDCVVVGQLWVDEVFKQLGNKVQLHWHCQDGDSLKAGDTLFELSGNARAILTGERTALNFLQTLSATATTVSHYLQHLAGTNTQLLDTRKTIPGLRLAQKYAVKCAGGTNHRIGLYDAYLIKENHIASCGSIQAAVSTAKTLHPSKKVEVEVESLDELQQAIDAGCDIVMLDNFSNADVTAAVALNQGKVKLEVSGNVEVERLKSLAALGVDYISVGALTKHIHAIDLSMRLDT